VTGQELALRFARPVAFGARIQVKELAGLPPTQLNQFAERFLDGRVGVMGKNDAPACLAEVCGIDALFDAKMLFGLLLISMAQLSQIFRRLFALDEGDQLLRLQRRQIILAPIAIDAIEYQKRLFICRFSHFLHSL